MMRRFVEEADRGQWTLLPECLGDFIDECNPVRVIDVFVDALDLAEMSFEGVEPAATDRPSYHPSVLPKLYIYGYLNRVQSSRRLEREADAMSKSCGCWVGSHQVTRQSQTSVWTALSSR
jgi:transposase